ncbi:MAG: hypothetical protein IJN50_02475 [Clostridia bacterium]|nr:hypothetical protein [Clostridia bacterium]
MTVDNTSKRVDPTKKEGPFRFHIFKDSEGKWTAEAGLKALLDKYTQEQIESMAILSDGHYILEFIAGFDQNDALVYVKTPPPPDSAN